MQILSLISAVFTALYGILNAFAGFSQLKAKKIQPWSAWLFIGFGLLLLASGITLLIKPPLALFLLVIGLIAIHLLAIQNGLYLYGRINPGHHLLRFVVSVVLLGLAFYSLR